MPEHVIDIIFPGISPDFPDNLTAHFSTHKACSKLEKIRYIKLTCGLMAFLDSTLILLVSV